MWKEITRDLPKQGDVVNTKISDASGERNEQELLRQRNLWFFPDGSMYVYYTPTHYFDKPGKK